MNNRLMNLLISIGVALAVWLLLMFLVSATASMPGLQRVLVMFGGSENGYIQVICYVAFVYAFLDLRGMSGSLRKEFGGFELNILPEEDQLVLTPEEVADIKLQVIDIEKKGVVYMLSDFIKKVCTQYRNDQSVAETLHVMEVQIENTREEMEGNLSNVRYFNTAIMSLGFIGTLIGLSSAIGNSHLAKTEEGMPILTSYLNAAFDTTLVALVLGLVLNYMYNDYLELMDKYYSKSKRYIVDNLISRIYKAS